MTDNSEFVQAVRRYIRQGKKDSNLKIFVASIEQKISDGITSPEQKLELLELLKELNDFSNSGGTPPLGGSTASELKIE